VEPQLSHLGADRLVLESWLIQDHFLSAVKVGHPKGLDQSNILALLHGFRRKALRRDIYKVC
jgi:hypothetical protein